MLAFHLEGDWRCHGPCRQIHGTGCVLAVDPPDTSVAASLLSVHHKDCTTSSLGSPPSCICLRGVSVALREPYIVDKLYICPRGTPITCTLFMVVDSCSSLTASVTIPISAMGTISVPSLAINKYFVL